MVEKLDPKFKPFIREELKKMGVHSRTMHVSQNKTYQDTTQEKWGPGGSKAKGAARKKTGKFTPKALEDKSEAYNKTKESKTEEEKSSEKPAQKEKGADAETEKNPDLKEEQSNKEQERGSSGEEGLDNENTEIVVVHGDGQGAPDNRTTDKDSNPVATSTGKDNRVCERLACDKGGNKVKLQSSAAPSTSGTSDGNWVTGEETGNSGAKSG